MEHSADLIFLEKAYIFYAYCLNRQENAGGFGSYPVSGLVPIVSGFAFRSGEEFVIHRVVQCIG